MQAAAPSEPSPVSALVYGAAPIFNLNQYAVIKNSEQSKIAFSDTVRSASARGYPRIFSKMRARYRTIDAGAPDGWRNVSKREWIAYQSLACTLITWAGIVCFIIRSAVAGEILLDQMMHSRTLLKQELASSLCEAFKAGMYSYIIIFDRKKFSFAQTQFI